MSGFLEKLGISFKNVGWPPFIKEKPVTAETLITDIERNRGILDADRMLVRGTDTTTTDPEDAWNAYMSVFQRTGNAMAGTVRNLNKDVFALSEDQGMNVVLYLLQSSKVMKDAFRATETAQVKLGVADAELAGEMRQMNNDRDFALKTGTVLAACRMQPDDFGAMLIRLGMSNGNDVDQAEKARCMEVMDLYVRLGEPKAEGVLAHEVTPK